MQLLESSANLLAELRNQPASWWWLTAAMAAIVFLAASWSIVKWARAVLVSK